MRSDPPGRTEGGRLKRVLFLLGLDPTGRFGSLEEQTLIAAHAFREAGGLFLPVFLRLDPHMEAQYAGEGLPVEAMDLTRFQPARVKQLLGLIRRNRIEVVHWNFYAPLANGYIWLLSVLAPRVEHHFTDHMSRFADSRGINRGGNLKAVIKRPLAFRHSKILCVSDFVLDQDRQRRWPNLQRMSYFINTDRFRPDPAARRQMREDLGVGDRFVALVIAQLIKDKGVDVAIRAIAELPPAVVLWVVGCGPEVDALAALAGTLGLGSRVHLLGGRRHVEPLMQAADCLVCPSTWREAAGLAILEAAGCGLPVLASRIGGIPEFVEDGRTGFLFRPGDHRELAERLRRLSDEPDLRRRMSREARAVAVERFATEGQLGTFLNHYRV
jgi:glycosyltransferase involved in cell wall biosynthesis